jgi:hypothetical protein
MAGVVLMIRMVMVAARVRMSIGMDKDVLMGMPMSAGMVVYVIV